MKKVDDSIILLPDEPDSMSDAGAQATTVSVVLGGVLVAVGLGAYVLSDFASVTALIPASFGVLTATLALVGREPTREQPAIYAIGLLGVVGVLGSTRGIPDIITLLTGGSVDSLVAPVTQGVMIAICLVLVGVAGRYVLETR